MVSMGIYGIYEDSWYIFIYIVIYVYIWVCISLLVYMEIYGDIGLIWINWVYLDIRGMGMEINGIYGFVYIL